ETIATRVANGETQAQVAADYGVSQAHICGIVKSEEKAKQLRQDREEKTKAIQGDVGVIHGDFRTEGACIADSSVDLIFTDPPYVEESIGLYGDLAKFAARVLMPGSWCLAYAGTTFLFDIMNAMAGKGLVYGWPFCVFHSDGDQRFRKLRIYNGWKPILGFYKRPLNVTWNWFIDVVSGGKEKDDHEWKQAIDEAKYFVEHLSSPGGFVCDPFAGSGTSLLAAKELGRRWLGFELDEKHVITARTKLI